VLGGEGLDLLDERGVVPGDRAGGAVVLAIPQALQDVGADVELDGLLVNVPEMRPGPGL